MKSSAIRNVTGLAVCLSLLGLAPAASASPSSAPSATLDAIASGVITNAHGQADRSGEVYVFALPDQSVLIGAPTGKTFPLTLVGYARTNAQGRYVVDARPASLMTANGRHGYANLQVIAVSGGRAAVADYSVMPAGAAWRTEGGTDSAPSLSFNFATRLATPPPVAAMAGASPAVASRIPITLMTVSAGLERLRAVTDFASAAMRPFAGPLCTVQAEGIYYKKPEHFVTTATASTGNKIPETVTEGTNNSSTHTLGVAFEGMTKGAKWTADGTGSITDTTTDGASSTYSGPRKIDNLVNYRQYLYRGACAGIERRPYSFYDLLNSNYGGPAPMSWWFNCGPHSAGQTWWTQTETSATIGGGVSLGPINLSAQAGFGTSVQLEYDFHTNGEVCGNNKEGPVHSSLVEADSA